MSPAARRDQGPCGWLAIDKPHGVGSASVVARVKSVFRSRRVGHAGTLDRPATGVLAVALGEATKTVSHVMASDKCYRFTVRFGSATETDDATGDVITTSESRPRDRDIESVLPEFRGDIFQKPPAYSSVRIGGRRAHEMARSGQSVAMKSRPLHVSRLVMLERPDRDHAIFEMICGKGGYVRSIARDIGELLGCLGHVEDLRRIRTGPFGIDDCIAFDAIDAQVTEKMRGDLVCPIEMVLADLPVHACSDDESIRIRNGNVIRVMEREGKGDCWLSHNGRAIALAHEEEGLIRPRRIIHQVT